jgi:hypothetical protein
VGLSVYMGGIALLDGAGGEVDSPCTAPRWWDGS